MAIFLNFMVNLFWEVLEIIIKIQNKSRSKTMTKKLHVCFLKSKTFKKMYIKTLQSLTIIYLFKKCYYVDNV